MYIFYPVFKDHFFVFKEVFSENSVLMYSRAAYDGVHTVFKINQIWIILKQFCHQNNFPKKTIYYSFHIILIPSVSLSILVSFLPNYCHSFKSLPFQVFVILISSKGGNMYLTEHCIHLFTQPFTWFSTLKYSMYLKIFNTFLEWVVMYEKFSSINIF